MTHQEILNKTKADIDSLCAQAKGKLDAIAPKALEIGKWYKHKDYPRFLSIHLNDDRYGFDISGYWFDDVRSKLSYHEDYYEATPQEVEKALIEEAKRRGYKEGIKFKSLIYDKDESKLSSAQLDWDEVMDGWWHLRDSFGESIFHNGQWATIIEQDKFAELKEAHRNGSVIQFKSTIGGEWFIAESPSWDINTEYRIKPEQHTRVGDVCKFWYENDETFAVGILQEIDDEGSFWCNYCCYTNAKTLTQQEAIELLFKNK